MMKPENRVFFLTWEDAIVAGIGLAKTASRHREMNMVTKTGPRFRPVFYLPKRRAETAEAVQGELPEPKTAGHRRYAARHGRGQTSRPGGKRQDRRRGAAEDLWEFRNRQGFADEPFNRADLAQFGGHGKLMA